MGYKISYWITFQYSLKFTVQDVSYVSSYAKDIFNQFPEVFTGLGNLGQEYQLQLKPDAQPFALHTSRKFTFHWLNRIEDVAKIDEPTPWCVGTVVVSKKSGGIWIYVDLNETIERSPSSPMKP